MPEPAQNSSFASDTPAQTIAGVLLSEKLISQEQLTNLKMEAAKQNLDVDKLIHDLQIVPEEKYFEALAKMLNVPFTSVASLPFSPEALGFIPKSVAERYSLITFAYDPEQKLLALVRSNRNDLDAIEASTPQTGAAINVLHGISNATLQSIHRQ